MTKQVPVRHSLSASCSIGCFFHMMMGQLVAGAARTTARVADPAATAIAHAFDLAPYLEPAASHGQAQAAC